MKAATVPAFRPQFYRDLLDMDIYVVNGGNELCVWLIVKVTLQV